MGCLLNLKVIKFNINNLFIAKDIKFVYYYGFLITQGDCFFYIDNLKIVVDL